MHFSIYSSCKENDKKTCWYITILCRSFWIVWSARLIITKKLYRFKYLMYQLLIVSIGTWIKHWQILLFYVFKYTNTRRISSLAKGWWGLASLKKYWPFLYKTLDNSETTTRALIGQEQRALTGNRRMMGIFWLINSSLSYLKNMLSMTFSIVYSTAHFDGCALDWDSRSSWSYVLELNRATLFIFTHSLVARTTRSIANLSQIHQTSSQTSIFVPTLKSLLDKFMITSFNIAQSIHSLLKRYFGDREMIVYLSVSDHFH